MFQIAIVIIHAEMAFMTLETAYIVLCNFGPVVRLCYYTGHDLVQ